MNYDDIVDVRRMTCPMPLLKTRNKIREMASGKILKIIGDFKPAIKNLKQFLDKEGHEILQINDDNTEFFILIKIIKK